MQMAYVPSDFEAALKFSTETVGADPSSLLTTLGWNECDVGRLNTVIDSIGNP
jgi:hypothetical protein